MDLIQEALSANQKLAAEAFAERFAKLQIENPKDLGFNLLSITETKEELGFSKGIGSIKIEYYDLKGEVTNFYRYRFLGQFEGFKYYQHPGTGTHLYLSKLISWKESLLDIKQPLILTEGEFKALQGCKLGLPTIGLGGVYNTSREINGYKALLEPLNTLPVGKIVYICFDYDGDGSGDLKEQVLLAEVQLAAALKLRGCDVRLIRLGEAEGSEKIGLDDFVQKGGSLTVKMAQAKRFVPTKKDGATYLLAKYAVVAGEIYNVETGVAYNQQRFQIEEANCDAIKLEKDKEMNATKAFLAMPARTTLRGLTFDPQTASIITSGLDLNLWRGFKTRPEPGDCAYWDHFLDLFFSEEPNMRQEFEHVIACMFQHPEIKQNKLLILQSPHEGIGKSLYFETIAALVNNSPRGIANGMFDHAVVTSGRDLSADFNSIVKGKRFVVFNEIGEKGEKHTNLIKDLVTAPSLTINEKYSRQISIPNYMQICITTNDTYTHNMGMASRREVIYSIPGYSDLGARLKTFFLENRAFLVWINTLEARQALIHRYMTMNINAFDPYSEAPPSLGKAFMAEGAQTDLDFYIIEENLSEVWFIVPKLEIERFRSMYHNMRISPSVIRSKFRTLGFGHAPHTDFHAGQANFACYDPPIDLRRPVVLANREAQDMRMPKDKMYEYVMDRYFGTRKL